MDHKMVSTAIILAFDDEGMEPVFGFPRLAGSFFFSFGLNLAIFIWLGE